VDTNINITEKVWKEYHSKLLAFITRRVDDRSAAEDILQDVFEKIHSRMDSLREEERLESWLYQITRNAVIDHYRTQNPSVELPEWISQPETDPSVQARQELEACLRPMIEQLPLKYRNALLLSELEGKTQLEVSKEQDISLSGAKSRVQRGRTLLKGIMFECCQFEFDHQGKVIEYHTKNNDCDSC
jgi:RNA polymerase sigma-70 factor (ECF subfamily)